MWSKKVRITFSLKFSRYEIMIIIIKMLPNVANFHVELVEFSMKGHVPGINNIAINKYFLFKNHLL